MDKLPYEFRARLLNLQENQAKQRKGDRTRARLKLATIDVLSERGYQDIKVSDITEEAGVSSGTFYLYFKNKTHITLEVLEEFVAHLDEVIAPQISERTAFQAIFHANVGWLKAIRLNAGLFKCILEIGDDAPQLSDLVHKLNARWYQRICENIARRFPKRTETNDGAILLATYSLGSMMDEICRSLIIHTDPYLEALVEDVTPEDIDFAEFLTLIWYRALYGDNPPDALSGHAAKLLASLRL